MFLTRRKFVCLSTYHGVKLMATMRVVISVISVLLFSACSVKSQTLSMVNAFPNLTFDHPVFLTHSGDATDRIFVVEQSGIIRVFANDSSVTSTTIFLNIEDRVTSGGEMGLLGLAFHPQFATNGFFYVNYTTAVNGPRRTVVSRFSVSATNSNKANASSEFILLEIVQPFSNHNGGMLQFGADGFLYVGTGDGGLANDPFKNGQSRTTLLGKILRIDVDHPDSGLNYGIPSDNPFVGEGNGVRGEIFAYGLRNPWRFSFDEMSGKFWAGDVGQNRIEEIDLIVKGANYGWNRMEGSECFDPQNPNNPPVSCDTTGLRLPIVDYSRNKGNSVTGGYVYRGALRLELRGAFIYGDFGSGNIFLVRFQNGQVLADSILQRTSFGISSFGVDEQNELYTLDYFQGKIYRFSANIATKVQRPVAPENNFILKQSYPNPFNPATVIEFIQIKSGPVTLTIYDLLGKKIKTLFNAPLSSGTHRFPWNGTDAAGRRVASGTYFYHLSNGSAEASKRMLLLR